MSDKPKLGRPTTNPKPHKLTVRVSEKNMQTLDDYCARKKISRADGVRDALECLKDK